MNLLLILATAANAFLPVPKVNYREGRENVGATPTLVSDSPATQERIGADARRLKDLLTTLNAGPMPSNCSAQLAAAREYLTLGQTYRSQLLGGVRHDAFTEDLVQLAAEVSQRRQPRYMVSPTDPCLRDELPRALEALRQAQLYAQPQTQPSYPRQKNGT